MSTLELQPLLAEVSRHWLDLAPHAVRTIVRTGDVVFREGSSSNVVHRIEAGLFKVTVETSFGAQPLVVALRSSGWLMGSAAVLMRARHMTSAIAISDSVLSSVDAGLFLRALNQSPDFLAAISRLHAAKLYDRTLRMRLLTLSSAESRVRLLLSLMARERRPGDDSPCWRLQALPHTELAHVVRLTPETFSRVLTRLERRGLLQRSGGWIMLTPAGRTQFDRERLEWAGEGADLIRIKESLDRGQ